MVVSKLSTIHTQQVAAIPAIPPNKKFEKLAARTTWVI